jgi:hypothetical protein
MLIADLATSIYKCYKPSTSDTIIKSIKKNTRPDYRVVISHITTVHTGYWIASLCDCDGGLITETEPCACEVDALTELEVMMRTY